MPNYKPRRGSVARPFDLEEETVAGRVSLATRALVYTLDTLLVIMTRPVGGGASRKT